MNFVEHYFYLLSVSKCLTMPCAAIFIRLLGTHWTIF